MGNNRENNMMLRMSAGLRKEIEAIWHGVSLLSLSLSLYFSLSIGMTDVEVRIYVIGSTACVNVSKVVPCISIHDWTVVSLSS